MRLFGRREEKKPVDQIERRVDTVSLEIDRAVARLEYAITREYKHEEQEQK